MNTDVLGSVPGWGAALYPSGYFTLWRQNGKTQVSFKEAFLSVGYSCLGGKTALRGVQKDTLREEWFQRAEGMDMRLLLGLGGESVESVVEAKLGSSIPVNSQKKRRGLGGLTSRGKNLVREAAIELERQYGRRRLTFWTVTLPKLSHDDYRSVCEHWSEICKNLKEKLLYHLRQAGLPPHIVAVTEMQEKRWLRDGTPAWHLHLVFVGRHLNGGWLLNPETADKLWSESVSLWCEKSATFQASGSLERVKKSVGRYLSKYLSKGSSVIDAVEEKWPGCIPSSWYICTKSLRGWVDISTRRGESIASWLYQLIQDSAKEIKALWAYCIETRPGQPLAVCWMGVISDPPRPNQTLEDYVIRMT